MVVVEGQRKALNPIFNTELWVPVSYPTSTQIIKCEMVDDNVKGDELIAVFFEKFNAIKGYVSLTPNPSPLTPHPQTLTIN